MTSVAYYKGQLMADRLQISLTSYPYSLLKGPKLFISNDREFAFAGTGPSIGEWLIPSLEVEVRGLLEFMYLSDREIVTAEGLSDKKVKYDLIAQHLSNAFIVTQDKIFLTSLYGMENVLKVSKLNDVPAGIGSSGTLLASLLAFGVSPKKAYKQVHRVDRLTGSEPDIVRVRDLNPFVVRLGVKDE